MKAAKSYKIFWIIVGLLIPIIASSQENLKSDIYFDNGELRVDTTLRINLNQFDIWHMSENNILAIVSNSIDYSNLARESGITGIAIIAFECDTLDLKNIRLIKNIGGGLDENIIKGIDQISEKIVFEFRHTQNIKKNEQINYIGTYYIPIDFSLIDLKKEMKIKNAIPIFDTKLPLIGRWIE